MDNTQKRTDELIDKVKDYNYNVGSLQVHAWTELHKLNSNKEFIENHKETIKNNKLTKLEEVQYVLDIVSEINDSKSDEVENRIRDLEKTKTVLEEYSKKIGSQIKFTNELLESQEKENQELRSQLYQKGLSEKDISKTLKLQQLNREKDDKIQRLSVALSNAKRELDIAYRSKSPNPQRLREEKVSTSEVTLQTQQEEPEGEKAAQILDKVRSILSNARKTINRGYTAETVNTKLAYLLEYEREFQNLDPKPPQIKKDFDKYIVDARKTLQSFILPPTSDNSVVNTENMASISAITKLVNNIVPTFFGTEGPDLTSEVSRFIQGCKLAERELITDDNRAIIPEVIECLKLRLMGSAYAQIATQSFGTVDTLCNAVKKLYLKTKTLDHIRELIISCRQGVKEPASRFGSRIESLLTEAEGIAASEWSDVNSRQTILKDFKRLAVKSFIKGLRDQALRTKFVGNENNDLQVLVQVVEDAEQLFGDSQIGINTVTATIPCSFCNQEGHNRTNCEQRLNTPYCVKCGVYGHEVGPACRSNADGNIETCGFCNGRGHKLIECLKRLRTLFCRICRTNGHTENRFCQRPQQGYLRNQVHVQNTQQNTNWQPVNNCNFRANNNMPRNQHNNAQSRQQPVTPPRAELNRDQFRQGRIRNEPVKCYDCNREGHIRTNCPLRNPGNSRRPSQN